MELNYTPEIMQTMNKVYGLSYKDRFLRICRNQNVDYLNYKKLLPQDILLDYFKETIQDTGVDKGIKPNE